MPAVHDPLLRAVARRIAAVRSERGITQEMLAVRLGTATKNVQRIESGRQNLTLHTIGRIARALGVRVTELITDPAKPTARRDPKRSAKVHPPLVPFRRVAGASSGAVPLMSLRAAAGAFGGAEPVEVVEWVVPSTRRKVASGMFVAQVDGTSMEPRVPAGSFVLFRAPVRGALADRIVLVQMRDVADAETGGRYAVKRVASVTRTRTGKVRVRLTSDNPTFAAIDVTLDDAADVAFIAEVVEVLGQSE